MKIQIKSRIRQRIEALEEEIECLKQLIEIEADSAKWTRVQLFEHQYGSNSPHLQKSATHG